MLCQSLLNMIPPFIFLILEKKYLKSHSSNLGARGMYFYAQTGALYALIFFKCDLGFTLLDDIETVNCAKGKICENILNIGADRAPFFCMPILEVLSLSVTCLCDYIKVLNVIVCNAYLCEIMNAPIF